MLPKLELACELCCAGFESVSSVLIKSTIQFAAVVDTVVAKEREVSEVDSLPVS